jgi:protein-tyrosine phosphatase
MPSILFVCTANLYRSPLAAAFLKSEVKGEYQEHDWLIDSAGTWTKSGSLIHAQTVEDASHFGLDVRNHRSRQVSSEILALHDLILVMEAGHKEALVIEFPDQAKKIHLLSEVVDGLTYDIPDPFSLEGQHDRNIATELRNIIKRGYAKIFKLTMENST